MLPAACVEPDGAVAPMRAAGAPNDDSLATMGNPTLCDGDNQNGEKGLPSGALSGGKLAIGTDDRPDAMISATGIQIVTACFGRFGGWAG